MWSTMVTQHGHPEFTQIMRIGTPFSYNKCFSTQLSPQPHFSSMQLYIRRLVPVAPGKNYTFFRHRGKIQIQGHPDCFMTLTSSSQYIFEISFSIVRNVTSVYPQFIKNMIHINNYHLSWWYVPKILGSEAEGDGLPLIQDQHRLYNENLSPKKNYQYS